MGACPPQMNFGILPLPKTFVLEKQNDSHCFAEIFSMTGFFSLIIASILSACSFTCFGTLLGPSSEVLLHCLVVNKVVDSGYKLDIFPLV